MTGVALTELAGYSNHERAKWKAWVAADPTRLAIPFQREGRFRTIGSLLDHVFLVERRHLSRLQAATPPESSGIAKGDWKALFEYGDLVRADFSAYLAQFDEAQARDRLTVVVQSGSTTMSKRRLATHILIHELRHMAQIALAVREAGHEPPGKHDLFYFDEFENL